jgi:alpha-L-fucosidase 2
MTDNNTVFAQQSLRIWFKQPAARWNEALPLGNGRMGAMIYGKPDNEVIVLTETTCFSGEKGHTLCREDASAYFYKARENLLYNDYESACENLRHFVGTRANYGTQLPMGHVIIKTNNSTGSTTDYQRSLCLRSAVSTVSYNVNKTKYARTAFISNPHQIMAIKLSCEKQDLDLAISIDGGNNPYIVKIDENHDLLLTSSAFENNHSDAIHSKFDSHCRVRYKDIVREFDLKAGQTCLLDNNLNIADASSQQNRI